MPRSRRRNDPRVVTVLRDFRQAVDAKESMVTAEMATRWLQVERQLEVDIALLAREVAERQAAGEVVTQQMLWRMERYHRLQVQMEREILLYNSSYAIPTIEGAQRAFGQLGLDAASSAISASYPGVGIYFDRIHTDAVETMVGYLGNGAPLNTLLRNDYPEAFDGMTKALINGVTRGYGPDFVARSMIEGTGMGFDRALLITRTEINRTYRSAALMQYRASGVVSGFKRLVKKETACLACLALDGETMELEAELDDHPRGKCIAVPIVNGTREPTWETGEDWFMQQSDELQAKMLGPERYAAWQSGSFKFKDLARFAHSDEWGDSPRVATIAELLGGN
jgi:hypothetical protein